jgi:4-hydroxybutyrate CoA-transferase
MAIPTRDATRLLQLLQPGMRVYVGGSMNEPSGLLEAIASAPDCTAGVTFVQFPLGALNRHDLSALHPEARVECFFMTPQLADGLAQGRVRFVPMQMRAIFDYLDAETFDVVLLQVAYGRDGKLRIGPNVDFAAAAMRNARCLVAELNRSVVAPAGCPLIDAGRFDHLIETERALVPYVNPQPDATARAIASHVAGLIRDGDCIQTGIGAIPAAILESLRDRNDLGLHSGLVDDGAQALIETGVLTGRAKAIDRGVHVTGVALGSAQLLRWLGDAPNVVFRGADYTHEVAVIRQLDNFVSINSAVEVDLYGQINAEWVAGKQISGTGGSVDFMRAAKASRGGRSIVALNATARGGAVSRIVPQVGLVTALRTDVDTVVTEFGVAELKHASAAARADALIAIAAPQFRDALHAAGR